MTEQTPRDTVEAADPQTKLAVLRDPATYPDSASVELVETHMSWVFLTERHAYKLKKPARTAYADFTTAEARRRDGETEIRLNRRLAEDVYLGLVALTRAPDRRLVLDGEGAPVDWLVKMRRLPAERMLDARIAQGRVEASRLRRAARRLAEFYRALPSENMGPDRYLARFRRDTTEARAALLRATPDLDAERIERVSGAQLAFIERRGSGLAARAARVVEAHGDLRPQHICLLETPVVIDCLEFNRELRLLDPADELAFLALECERLGAPGVGATFLEVYGELSGDAPATRLIHFYKTHRACVRAKLALWHPADDHTPDKWRRRAREYLALADRYASAL